MQLLKGVDVSHHQNDKGAINWPKVFAQGYEFVFVKLTEGKTYIDPCSRDNVADARKAGAKVVGGYHFARFQSVNEALAEAEHFASVAKDLALDYVVLDIEHPEAKGDLSDAARAFLEAVKAYGKPMLYSYPAFIDAHLKSASLAQYPLWIAHYHVDDPRDNSVWGADWLVWQHASDAKVDGIVGNVDVNVAKPELLIEQMAERKPKPKPKPAATERLLRRGDRGDDVKALQKALNAKGFDCGEADGIFGPKTEAAVKALQKAAHIAVDGIVGPQTRKALAAAKVKSKYPLPNGVYRKGDKGNAVKQIQTALNAANFKCGAVDGIFGAKTEDAVKRFQSVYLPREVDGVYGPHTKAALEKVLR